MVDQGVINGDFKGSVQNWFRIRFFVLHTIGDHLKMFSALTFLQFKLGELVAE